MRVKLIPHYSFSFGHRNKWANVINKDNAVIDELCYVSCCTSLHQMYPLFISLGT